MRLWNQFYDLRIQGLRLFDALVLICLFGEIVGVQVLKTGADLKEARIAHLNRDIASESQKVRILRDRLSRLDQPQRIEALSRKFLGLSPIAANKDIDPSDISLVLPGSNSQSLASKTPDLNASLVVKKIP